ncbi:MAG: metallophosphoesterase family protein [Kiritimatiellia bacterium]
MNRREFLQAGLLGGGLLATSALPAADAPRRSSEMNISYFALPIGAERPFTVLHLSDTHLKAVAPSDPEPVREFLARRFPGWDPADALATSLAYARHHACDYVLHTGDLIDCATDGNVALLKQFFGADARLLYAPGNHEFATTYAAPVAPQTEAEFRAVNTAKVQAAAPVDLSFHAEIVHGVNFVLLDDVYGTVAPESVERFHAEAKKGLPIVLCQHVPFFSSDLALAHARSHTFGLALEAIPLPHASRDFRRQAEDKVTADFIRYLKSEPLLKAILAGHYHSGMCGRFSPTAMQYVVGANYRYCGQEIMIY